MCCAESWRLVCAASLWRGPRAGPSVRVQVYRTEMPHGPVNWFTLGPTVPKVVQPAPVNPLYPLNTVRRSRLFPLNRGVRLFGERSASMWREGVLNLPSQSGVMSQERWSPPVSGTRVTDTDQNQPAASHPSPCPRRRNGSCRYGSRCQSQKRRGGSRRRFHQELGPK